MRQGRALTARPQLARLSGPLLHLWVPGAILLLAAFLRFHRLTASSLWHDEGNTWAQAQRGFGAIAAAAAADIHPPGYYWLLRGWSLALGTDAWALRGFSAFAGILAVAVVMALARRVAGRGEHPLVWGAGLLAAVHPFGVYYSQEARMYALLMLESAGLLYGLVRWLDETESAGAPLPGRSGWFGLGIYLVAGVWGLWTHYLFPVMLAAGALAGMWTWGQRSRAAGRWELRRVVPFLGVNLLAVLLYLPWLPIAVDRVLRWPAGGVRVPMTEGLGLTLQTLVLGPIRNAPELGGAGMALAAGLFLVGLWRLRFRPGQRALALWVLSPVGTMAGLGLFTEAFLKFLLVAAPAWTLATAAGLVPWSRHRSRCSLPATAWEVAAPMVVAAALVLSGLSPYYRDPLARDNYAGMARTVMALGNPTTDRVVLDAPGQQEVWAYYDPGVPVLALPRQRPPDRAATEAELARELVGVQRVFALFWATDQADPEGIVEGWLDRRGFKGLESWQGNVRFVLYRLAAEARCTALEPPARFGEVAALREVCLPREMAVTPGDVLPVELGWRALGTPDRRFKVTLQVLDPRDQVWAQRDGEPVGGSRPTVTWRAGEEIRDRQGIYVPPGTPPGRYRLLLALYDPDSGERLPVDVGPGPAASAWMGFPPVQVIRPTRPLPPDILAIQRRVQRRLGPVVLLGADVYRRGFAHAPNTPVLPGQWVQVTLYWQAPDPLPPDWPPDMALTLRLGAQVVSGPLAGETYPTALWQPGDLIRGRFALLYEGGDRDLWLEVAGQQIRLGRIPR